MSGEPPMAQSGRLKEFGGEFQRCWKLLPEKTLFFGGLGAWVLLFQVFGHCSFNFSETPSLFLWMWGAYSAPALDSSHGKLIPLVVLVVLWIRRNDLLSVV